LTLDCFDLLAKCPVGLRRFGARMRLG